MLIVDICFLFFLDFFLYFVHLFSSFYFFNNKNQLTNFSIYYYVCINTYLIFFSRFFHFLGLVLHVPNSCVPVVTENVPMVPVNVVLPLKDTNVTTAKIVH